MNENPGALLPEIVLLIGAVATLMTGSFVPQDKQWAARVLAVASLAVSLIAGAVAALGSARTEYSSTYALDVATSTARILIPAASLLVIAMATHRVRGNPRESEFYVLILLASLGSVVMAGSSDLLILAIAYLLASIPLYALTGWGRDAPGTEAALKLYLMGALLGIIMMVGIAVLYGVGGGNTDYVRLADGLRGAPPAALAFGVVAVLAGLLFKVGAVPSHFWVPDAVDGATTGVGAFLTTIPKIGGLIAIFRLLVIIPDDSINWPLLIGVIAAATMTLGNLAAFAQIRPARLLAYSTISQAGYLLMAVAVSVTSDLALPSMLFYLIGYSAANLCVFAVVAAVPERSNIPDFRGLVSARPALTAALVIGLLGLVGTPPTGLFVGKVTVFSAAWDGGMSWLVVIAAVNTVASLYYYLRWLAPAVRPGAALVAGPPSAAGSTAVMASAVTIASGLAAGPLLGLLDGALVR